jgi:hypothetical protein
MTSSSPIPTAVAAFILTRFPSVPHLEAVLHLRSSGAASVEDIARSLYLPEPTACRIAESLVESGLLSRDGSRYKFAAAGALADMMDQVDREYAGNLVAVTMLIHGGERRSAQHFADAFKLRKDS